MADTGADAADMKTQVQAYRMSMTALVKKVLPMGGYWCDTHTRVQAYVYKLYQ